MDESAVERFKQRSIKPEELNIMRKPMNYK